MRKIKIYLAHKVVRLEISDEQYKLLKDEQKESYEYGCETPGIIEYIDKEYESYYEEYLCKKLIAKKEVNQDFKSLEQLKNQFDDIIDIEELDTYDLQYFLLDIHSDYYKIYFISETNKYYLLDLAN